MTTSERDRNPAGAIPSEMLIAGSNLRVDVATREVTAAFEAGGVDSILLKGPALARLLYEQPGERAYCDVDLLVGPQQVARAEEILGSLGFACTDPGPRIPLDRPIEGRAWVRDGDAVDLHHSLPEIGVEPEQAWEYLWSHSITERLRGTPVRVLDVPRRALLVALHAAHHGPDVRQPLEDLRRAVSGLPSSAWRSAVEAASVLSAEDALGAGLRLIPEGRALASTLGLDVAPWLKGRIMDQPAEPGSRAVALGLHRLTEVQGTRAKLAFVVHKLFPPKDYMRIWAETHAIKGGLIVAYIRRLAAFVIHALSGISVWRRSRSLATDDDVVDAHAGAAQATAARPVEGGRGSARAAIRRARESIFARAVAGTAGANMVATILGSLGGILLARGLGATLRGQLALVVTWPTFVGLIALLGLPQATCYMVSKSPSDARRILGTGSIGSFVVSAAIGGIGVLVSPLITSNPESVHYLRVLFALLPVYTIPIVWIATLQAVRIQHWNFARMVQPAVYFAGIATYTLAGTLTVGKGVAALVLSLFVQLMVGGVLVWREVGPPGSPSAALWRPLFAYGIKSTASLGPYLVNYRLDQLVLSVMVPAAALGNYTVAVSVSVLATPIAFAFGYVAFPRIAAARSRAEARKVERMAIFGSVIVATAVLVPMGLLARWVIPVVFGSGFDRAVIALWLLIPGTIAFSANQVAEDILRGRGRPLAPAIAEGVGVALTVGLLLILVPRLGIYGAAITSAFVYAGVAAILATMLRKHPEDTVSADTGQSFEIAGSNA